MKALKGDPKKTSSAAVKRMLDSGNWKLGPNGELIRVGAQEANQAALQKSKEAANPTKYSPTKFGFMTPERKAYLEGLDRKLTPEEAREYATEAFNPSTNPNALFSLVAGSLVPAPNVYKINPAAIKNLPSDPNKFYRVVPKEAYDDFLSSGVVRAKSKSAPAGADLLESIKYRPTANPSFNKGKPLVSYGKGDPNAVVFEVGPRGGAFTAGRAGGQRGRHFANFPLDKPGGKIVSSIPASEVEAIYRATPHPVKGYVRLK